MNLEDALNHRNHTKPTTAETPANTAKPTSAIIAKEEFRSVDVSIAGTPHRIICPANEVKNLENGVDYINQKIRDLRREIKHRNPSNEEFLALVCLELYDQVQTLQQNALATQKEHQEVQALIEKINKEARSML